MFRGSNIFLLIAYDALCLDAVLEIILPGDNSYQVLVCHMYFEIRSIFTIADLINDETSLWRCTSAT